MGKEKPRHYPEKYANRSGGDWQANGSDTNPEFAPLFHSECKECSPVEDHWKPRGVK